MNFEAVTKMILDQFKKQNVRCAIIGGFALHALGLERATNDIDFLVHVEDVSKIKSILNGLGYEITHESKDVVNFWGKLKELGGIDFIIAHRKYALAMLDKTQTHDILKGQTVQVVRPEDVIGLKLQAYS